jgi:hypothetical protein
MADKHSNSNTAVATTRFMLHPIVAHLRYSFYRQQQGTIVEFNKGWRCLDSLRWFDQCVAREKQVPSQARQQREVLMAISFERPLPFVHASHHERTRWSGSIDNSMTGVPYSTPNLVRSEHEEGC